MNIRFGVERLLVSSALACAGGCMGADVEPLECESSGRCDNLIGRGLRVYPDETPTPVDEIPATFSVAPELIEGDDVVLVFTDDLRFRLDDLVAPGRFVNIDVDTGAESYSSSKYGFQLQYRLDGGGEWDWETVTPPLAEGGWFWSAAGIRDHDDEIQFGGTAIRVSGSIAPTWEVENVHDLRLPAGAEFRALVVPLYNFLDWEETGYETTVEFYSAAKE